MYNSAQNMRLLHHESKWGNVFGKSFMLHIFVLHIVVVKITFRFKLSLV